MSVILLSREISPDALHQLNLIEKMDVQILEYPKDSPATETMIARSDTVIDALIGYNLDGAPRGSFQEMIDLINESGKTVVAYDVPSGLDATTGECPGSCIKTNVTLSLAVPKEGLRAGDGPAASGTVFVGDIGIPAFLYNYVATDSRPPFERAGGVITL